MILDTIFLFVGILGIVFLMGTTSLFRNDLEKDPWLMKDRKKEIKTFLVVGVTFIIIAVIIGVIRYPAWR
jgi:uncharacterized membrane protein